MPPPQRNPLLGRLEALVGEWEMHAKLGGQTMAGGHTEFHWIEDGAFLIQHADADLPPGETPAEWLENSPFPVTTIIGLDDSSETFCYAYSDGRGVSRVYRMTLDDGVWKIWGQSGPEFFQRFTGTFGGEGKVIDARWEKSADGSEWDLDFELTYTKLT
jgi:hypothetical protein